MRALSALCSWLKCTLLLLTALYSFTGMLTRPKLSVPIHIERAILIVSNVSQSMSTRGWSLFQPLPQPRESLADQRRALHLRNPDPLADLGLRQILAEAQPQHQSFAIGDVRQHRSQRRALLGTLESTLLGADRVGGALARLLAGDRTWRVQGARAVCPTGLQRVEHLLLG